MSYNNNRLASNNELIGGKDIEKETAAGITDLFFKAAIFVFVFILLFLNLLAVSLSLQCNESRDMPFKIASAMFAFMFGFIYIFINYFLYKINVRKWPCILNSNDPFFISKPKENKGSKSTGSQGTSGQSSQAAPEVAKNNSGGDDEFD
jgi:hypothetical protein